MSALKKLDNSTLSLLADKSIASLEKEFMKHEQVPCPVVHRFGPGVYIREVKIPAGTVAIGHHQNFEHMNLFLQGKVSMLDENGNVTTLTAPMSFVGKPGRKIGYIHEDMVWLNIYPTSEQDVEKLEAEFLTKNDSWGESLLAKQSVKLIQNKLDSDDFDLVVKESGFTKEIVRAQAENESDMTELPFGGYKIKTAKSNIEGIGLFATADIEPGEQIAPARIGAKRTIAGRFTNHSASPNAKMVEHFGDIMLIATKKITGCAGGIDGEEITINYREALSLNLQMGRIKCQE